jgi:hypothetical protein
MRADIERGGLLTAGSRLSTTASSSSIWASTRSASSAASFLLLGIGLASFGMRQVVAQALGNTPAAIQAASYLHISLGDGFWLVLLGLLVIVGAIAKRFFVTLAVLILGVVVLSFVHAGWISPFLHRLGF